MVESNVFSLSFISNGNGRVNFSIPRANASLTANEVRSRMDNLIAADIIISGGRKPVSVAEAELVTTTTQVVNI